MRFVHVTKKPQCFGQQFRLVVKVIAVATASIEQDDDWRGGVGWGGVNEAGRKEIFGLDISFDNTMAKNNHIKIDLR